MTTSRIVLITGGTAGIGLGLARRYAGAGARVVVAARPSARLDDVPQVIPGATSIAVDLEAPEGRDALADAIVERYGRLDVLVNNAGIQRRAPIAEFADTDWDDLVRTNLSSAFYVSRRVAGGMISRGSGKLVQIGSVQSQLARPSIAAYGATKGAIAMLTKGLCADLAPHGIQANAIAPGYFATELTRALVDDEKFSAWVRSRTPAGRWGNTGDLVGALVFLSSSASDFVNGQTIFVDGGMTAVV